MNIKFIAPNASFRNVMVETLTQRQARNKTRTKMLFTGSSQFYKEPADMYDVLVVDEAHRLKGKGEYQYFGENQIEDIIKASKVNVFFKDDFQHIHPTANFDGWDQDSLEFKLVDTPNEVYDLIKSKNDQGYKARMLAGFAWNARSISSTWAIHESGIDQIGCVHTS
ncbi:DNA/RNA helicase domain-containing protein [Paenibacillus sp. FSL R5-0473]|uniref:DNA/RNA helicase domain-containing protein n=1 Tax=Paenibacillus sp. FSL R5-0473 TaxID=2921642 RepID=UPI0030FBB164